MEVVSHGCWALVFSILAFFTWCHWVYFLHFSCNSVCSFTALLHSDGQGFYFQTHQQLHQHDHKQWQQGSTIHMELLNLCIWSSVRIPLLSALYESPSLTDSIFCFCADALRVQVWLLEGGVQPRALYPSQLAHPFCTNHRSASSKARLCSYLIGLFLIYHIQHPINILSSISVHPIRQGLAGITNCSG